MIEKDSNYKLYIKGLMNIEISPSRTTDIWENK